MPTTLYYMIMGYQLDRLEEEEEEKVAYQLAMPTTNTNSFQNTKNNIMEGDGEEKPSWIAVEVDPWEVDDVSSLGRSMNEVLQIKKYIYSINKKVAMF